MEQLLVEAISSNTREYGTLDPSDRVDPSVVISFDQLIVLPRVKLRPLPIRSVLSLISNHLQQRITLEVPGGFKGIPVELRFDI